MRLSFQIFLVIFVGCLTLYAGAINFYDPAIILASAYNIDITSFSREAQRAITTQIRIFAGMWMVAGIFIFLSVKRFELHTNAIRLVIVGSLLGVIGELITVKICNGDLKTTLIKCLFTCVIYLGIELWRIFLVKKYNSIGKNQNET